MTGLAIGKLVQVCRLWPLEWVDWLPIFSGYGQKSVPILEPKEAVWTPSYIYIYIYMYVYIYIYVVLSMVVREAYFACCMAQIGP